MMKRKLDVNDVPTADTPTVKSSKAEIPNPPVSFASFNLDPRLYQAIATANFAEPTLVQQKTIPVALEGKDLLVQARTGSGKTAAYVLPILQSILQRKAINPKAKSTTALILAPTRDLSEQIAKVFASFAEYCSKDVRVLNVTQRYSDAVLNAKLNDSPDIVISTPGRARQLSEDGIFKIKDLKKLVIDEADQILSLDYGDDIEHISTALPKGIQSCLVSATLTPDVEQLNGVFCRDPVVIKIDNTEEKAEEITQYIVKCGEEEKFLLIFVILKLKLVMGKCIVFVADVDRSYRLKLYLEQYGIKSCVLNSELPVNSRLRTVEEFNRGLYEILIAADDQEVIGGIQKKGSVEDMDGGAHKDFSDEDQDSQKPAPKKPKLGQERDFGVSRGIDFQNVSCILNFDLPATSKSYTHRIGRTARAGNSGTAISFIIPRSEYNKHKPTTHPSTRNDERVLEKITKRQAQKGNELKDLPFDMDAVSGFRYRMNDALRAVTRVAIREARAREIKSELVRSEKLRQHFEDNPEDLRHLQKRSDGGQLGGGGVVRVQGHLKHVPDYLLSGTNSSVAKVGDGSLTGVDSRVKKFKNNKQGYRNGKKRFAGSRRKNDPLKSFKSGRK